jgi:ribosomal protein S18 acetylase RimI-like enzyme
VLTFRQFRNTDPPRLVEVWNEAFTGRGAVRLRNSSPLERQAFARAYFDPAGLILAEEDGRCVGFVHAGFGANEQESGVSYTSGVICLIAVRPSHQRRGVGGDLLGRAEAYLRQRGAERIFAGQVAPLDPFYHGLYGGAEMPGFLGSDPVASPFFLKHGYECCRTLLVMQRDLTQPLKQFDARFLACRQRYEMHEGIRRRGNTWWHEVRYGMLEPLAFCLEDKVSGAVVAVAQVWELEGFSFCWGQPSVGLFQLEVRQDLRRHGLGKFLVAQILGRIQEQYFALMELHIPADNVPALHLCQSLGFEQVDVGNQYVRA